MKQFCSLIIWLSWVFSNYLNYAALSILVFSIWELIKKCTLTFFFNLLRLIWLKKSSLVVWLKPRKVILFFNFFQSLLSNFENNTKRAVCEVCNFLYYNNVKIKRISYTRSFDLGWFKVLSSKTWTYHLGSLKNYVWIGNSKHNS